METNKKVTPCSLGTAACNPAVSKDHSVADPDPNQLFLNKDWPSYLVIKSKDSKSIVKHNIFVISKSIQGIAGTVKNVNFLKKSDMILVEVSQKQQAINLLGTKMLHDIPVEVSAHRTLNSVKGVITCDFLEGLKNDEILGNFIETGQHVKEVNRINTWKDGKQTPTNTFILTFSGDTLPEKMYVGMCRVSVRQYIPNPRQCFKCYKFRHTRNFCKDTEPTCGRCGQTGHTRDDCDENPFCVNCKGNHQSSSRVCPVWKKEKRIVELKFKENITFPEAIKRVENETNFNGKSTTLFSTIVSAHSSKSKCEMSCQTDLTWPDFLTSPVLTSECVMINDKGCQSTTEKEMEFESNTTKRSRRESSSSQEEDGMPSITTKRPLKRNTAMPSKDSALDQAAIPPSGGNAAGQVGGEGGNSDQGVSRGSSESDSSSPLPPPRTSRSGGKDPPRSGGARKLSPVKPP